MSSLKKLFLQASTENAGSDNASEVGSCNSLISTSTLPTDARSLKRVNDGSFDFDTDAIPESAKPALADLFHAVDAAHAQAEILRSAVEAVRNALSPGLVSPNSYRLSRLFLSNVLLICLSAEATQKLADSLHLSRPGYAIIVYAVCRQSYKHGERSLRFYCLH